MKTNFFTAIILSIPFLFVGQNALADSNPSTDKIVDVQVEAAFIPVGFDSNDESLVVVDGFLPNTCYKVAPAVVNLDLEHKQIIVEQRAKVSSGICIRVFVPFTSVIKLGVLPPGEFSVVTNHGKLAERLEVKAASTSASDDFLYAPIDSAQVEERADGSFVAILNGRLTNTCAIVDHVKVYNHEKTLEVLPVMRLMTPEESGFKCAPVVFGFRKEVTLPVLPPGSHLLHVRSLDGQSLNTIFRGPSHSNLNN